MVPKKSQKSWVFRRVRKRFISVLQVKPKHNGSVEERTDEADGARKIPGWLRMQLAERPKGTGRCVAGYKS